MMQDADLTIARLEAIRSLGVLVALDDFGTGWSSMSWLRELPVDALKIPKEFLGGLGASEKDWEFARAIVTLGHSLRLGVIAEGIEYADQVDRLREIGVESGQGFFFSPPVEAASIPTLLGTEAKALAAARPLEAAGTQTSNSSLPARRLPASSVGSRPPALNVPCGGGRSRPGRPRLPSSVGSKHESTRRLARDGSKQSACPCTGERTQHGRRLPLADPAIPRLGRPHRGHGLRHRRDRSSEQRHHQRACLAWA